MKKIIIFGLALLFIKTIVSQQDMNIYHLQNIPQSNYSNPALIPAPKLYISMPLLSSIYVQAGHTGANMHQFMSVSEKDSVDLNLERLLKKTGKYNFLYINTSIEFLSFGFRLMEKHYINFSFSNKINGSFCYPKDFLNFLYKGNGAFLDETLKFKKLGVNAMHYNELMFGYNLQFDEKWTFGAHLKFLFGLGNIYSKKSDITLHTEQEHFFITATSDIEISASLPDPMWKMIYDTNEVDFKFSEYLFNFSNPGFGIDLGATYKYNDNLTLGASIIDLGFIRWKTGAKNLKSNNPGGSFTFEGIDIAELWRSGSSESLEELMDSIADIFMIDTINKAYTAPLHLKTNFSGIYSLTANDYITALLRLHLYHRALHPGFTVGYVRKFTHRLSLHTTYSMISRKYFNLGFGIVVSLQPFQLYVTTDNIISPFVHNKYYWEEGNTLKSMTFPRNTKFMNAHFGINLIFGYKPPKLSFPIF